jgi:hypothetical protein
MWGILAVAYEVTDEVTERIARAELERVRQAENQRTLEIFEQAPLPISILQGPELRFTAGPRTSVERVMSARFTLRRPATAR